MAVSTCCRVRCPLEKRDRDKRVRQPLAKWTAGALFLALAGLPATSRAQQWTYRDASAGLAVNGAQVGLAVACLGSGRARMTFSGFRARLQPDEDYTVSLRVDDTAHLFQARAERGQRFESVLVVEKPLDVFASVIDALRAGREATVAGPAGRYVVPLRGSADALGALRAGC